MTIENYKETHINHFPVLGQKRKGYMLYSIKGIRYWVQKRKIYKKHINFDDYTDL